MATDKGGTVVGTNVGLCTVGKPDGSVATLANAALSQVWQFYEVYERDVKMTHYLCSVIIQRWLLGCETYPGFLYCQFCQMEKKNVLKRSYIQWITFIFGISGQVFFFFYLTCPFALLFYFIYFFVNSIYYYHQNLAATNNYLNFNFVLLKAP